MPECQNCETQGPDANAWGGWCHDCDASLETAN